jgi:cell division septal protein FtsQ
MGSDRAIEVILDNMGAKNTKKYGPINDQNGWRIQTNDELQVMYRESNIKEQ